MQLISISSIRLAYSLVTFLRLDAFASFDEPFDLAYVVLAPRLQNSFYCHSDSFDLHLHKLRRASRSNIHVSEGIDEISLIGKLVL